MSHTVSVNELKLGMYVHLDLGWMSHPFPRSSFRIDSAEQIQTIRSLGLTQVRWDPSRSELQPQADAAPAAATPRADAVKPEDAECPALRSKVSGAAARELRRHREAEQLCEVQYEEAGQALALAFGRVQGAPEEARQEIEKLSRALRDKMLDAAETCIRVLNAAAGDRATEHPMNVAVLAMLLGKRLGLAAEEVARIGVGAMLHDIGKLDLPEALRHADPCLGAAEQAAYASHVEHGVRQARRMGVDEDAFTIIGHHHERADGSGFPRRLGGHAIPLGARIVSLVNHFDNLCNAPLLAQALTPHEAMASLFARHRVHYDAAVLHAFIRLMGVYPAGSLVQLTDERLAMVVSVSADRPLKPRVLVYDPAVPPGEAMHLDLQRAPDLGIRRSLRAAQLPADALGYLAPRARTCYFFEPVEAALAETEAQAA